MRARVGLGGLVAALGVLLLVLGVHQQSQSHVCGHCAGPSPWPVTMGILLLLGGGSFLVWALAAVLSSRAFRDGSDLEGFAFRPLLKGDALPDPEPEERRDSGSPFGTRPP